MNLLDTLRFDFQRSRHAVLRYARNLVDMKSVILEMIRQASNGKVSGLGRKRWKQIRSKIRSALSTFESDPNINIANASELVATNFFTSRLDRSEQLRRGEIKELFIF